MKNEENTQQVMLSVEEYENFVKYQKSLKIEEKKKEINKIERKIQTYQSKIETLRHQEMKHKEDLKELVKSK
jgi:adenylosuccinate lyase